MLRLIIKRKRKKNEKSREESGAQVLMPEAFGRLKPETCILCCGEMPRQRIHQSRKESSGSITIYLALMLIVIFSLICTVTESARMSSVVLQARSLSYMAADSVFSEFAEQVFSDYGIMVLWKDDSEFTAEFNAYVSANTDTSDILYSVNADFYGIAFQGSTLSDTVKITDDSGLIFAQQVYEYMQYYMTQTAASEILESLGIFTQSSSVSSFAEEIDSYSEVFTAVEESAADIEEAIEQAQEISEDPSELLESLYEAVSSYSEGEASESAFEKALDKLKSAKEEIEGALEDIQEKTDEYYENVQSALEAVEDLENSLEEYADDLDSEIYESFEEQLAQLREQSADADADYYSVAANEQILEEYLSEIESLEELFGQLEESLTEENAAEYMALISEYQEIFSDFDPDSLGISLDTETVSTESTSVLSFISSLISKGVLAYVKEDISENTADTSLLPSVTENTGSSEDEEDISDLTANKIIFGEYILSHFGSAAGARDDTVLEYEIEYIIGGKSSDLENLKTVVSRLVALRSGLNFVSILTDSEKKQEAESLAQAMVGVTGMPVLIKAVQMLIMTAWSAAEAVADVKTLLEGGEVPAIKDSDEWSLTIEGFKNFNGRNLETASCEDGLGYEDYLRVLLAVQDSQTQYYRTMDLIQMDMCLNVNEDFLMADCIASVEIEAYYTASQLFAALPFADIGASSSGGIYSFSITQTYGY